MGIHLGTVLVAWLVILVTVSAGWEAWRVFLAHHDVASHAWQERHRLLRQQLEHTPSDQLQDQFDRRLAQAAAYARQHNLAPENFLDATTAREVRLWQQQQMFAEHQTLNDNQQQIRHLRNER